VAGYRATVVEGIRPARTDDVTAIRTVARSSWHAAYDDFLGPETVDRTVDEWYALDSLRAVIEDSEHVVSVAEDRDTAVLGFAHVGQSPEDDGLSELYRIYVRPERWGEGIGSRLLADVTERVTGYDRLGLSVFTENEVGIEFYEREGFERVGTEEIEFEGGCYEEIRYERPL
jgi:ribosomal protein S18 acetylase RimI-like enzyme